MTTQQTQKIQDRWLGCLDQGFVVLPIRLLRNQFQLKLDNTELVVLTNLIAMWHSNAEDAPYQPGLIAKNMGVSARTVQRTVGALEDKGFLEVAPGLDGKVVKLSRLPEVIAKIA